MGLPLRSAWDTRACLRRSASVGGSVVRGGERLTAAAKVVAGKFAFAGSCEAIRGSAEGLGDVDLVLFCILEKNFFTKWSESMFLCEIMILGN